MIQDPYAFLSPTGGDERLSAFSSWGAFGYTLTVGLGLVEKLLLDPASKAEVRNTVLKSKDLRIAKKRAGKYGEERRSYKQALGAFDAVGPTPAAMHKRNIDFMKSRFVQNKRNIRDISSSIKGQYAGIGSFLRGTSAIMGMSMLMEAGIDIFTPGVNKLAEKKEAKFMMESLTMDTGAAFTQRQRAMQAIYDSQSQVQHVIGNEAAYLHG